MARFEIYCKAFDIKSVDIVLPEEEVDLSLIRELVNTEIMILRTEHKIAIDGDFLGQTIAHVTKKDDVYYEDTVSPAADFQMSLVDRRHKILRLLNSTRKDHANEINLNDPSIKTSILMDKVEKIKMESQDKNLGIIDVDLTEDQLLNEDGSINFDIIDSISDKIDEEEQQKGKENE